MKKTVLLLFLLVNTSLFTQCIQIKKLKKMKIFNKELIFPNITSENEQLLPSQIKKRESIEAEIEKSNHLSAKNQSLNHLEQSVKENDCFTRYSLNKDQNLFEEIAYQKINPDGSSEIETSMYFMEGKSYYSSGGLRDKWLYFKNGSSDIIILKKFEYNSKGKLISEFDISKVYKQSLADIFRILEKNNLVLDFNKAAGYGSAGIPPSFIKPVKTNRGKVWIINALMEGFQAVIYDKDGSILTYEPNKNPKQERTFLFTDSKSFNDQYQNKSIEEVEKETNIQLFIYSE